MPAIDYSDENVIKDTLRKLVDRERDVVFRDLDKLQHELEEAAAGLEGSDREEFEGHIAKARDAKLEAITLFKGMHDFLA